MIQNGPSVDSLSYGVTFSLGGHQKELHELDALLERYSSFSSPTLVHGDKAREQLTSAGENGSGKLGAVVIPKEVVSSDGKKVFKSFSCNLVLIRITTAAVFVE